MVSLTEYSGQVKGALSCMKPEEGSWGYGSSS